MPDKDNVVSIGGDRGIGEEKVQGEEVLGFILPDGNQVITEVMETEEGDTFFKNPFFVSLLTQPNGRSGIMMRPFVGYSSQDEFGPINGSVFICGFEVPDNMASQYKSQVLKMRAQQSGLIIGQNMKVGPPDIK